jgi:hypothetical protein
VVEHQDPASVCGLETFSEVCHTDGHLLSLKPSTAADYATRLFCCCGQHGEIVNPLRLDAAEELHRMVISCDSLGAPLCRLADLPDFVLHGEFGGGDC